MKRGHISFCVANVTWINLHPLAFIIHFLNQFWIASRLVCSFCEAMAGSLSTASTAVSSAKVAVVDSDEGLQYIASIIVVLGHCLEYAYIDWGQFCVLSFNLH
jgi:hypothetical protein